MAIKLISVNIERSKHLDRVLPFIARERPDVLCVQELMSQDVAEIKAAMGAIDHVFAPMTTVLDEKPGGIFGLGIFTRVSMRAHGRGYYVGNESVLPEMHILIRGEENNENRILLWCDCADGASNMRIGTTHFTWTPDGNASDEQRRDFAALSRELEKRGEFLLCGDFNAPRGGEIFGALAARYRDNIPAPYTTSLDKDLHRAGDLQLMVDGLFSTPSYRCFDVHLVNGVSDHMAIVASVEKVPAGH